MRRALPRVAAPVAAAAVAAALALTGCPAAKKPPSPSFPTVQALAEIAGQPAPDDETASKVADIESWSLEGKLPAVNDGPHTAEGVWDAFLAQMAAQHGGRVRLTESMHCVARELGRFSLEKQARPPDDLRLFVAASCKASIGSLAATVVPVRSPPASEQTVLTAVQADLSKAVQAMLASASAMDAGIWYGRQGNNGVIYVSGGSRLANVEVKTPGSGPSVVRGEMLVPAVRIDAYVNRGRFGAVRCSVNSRELPAFEIECEPDPSDTGVWIDVVVAPDTRALSRRVLTILVRGSRTYTRPGFVRTLPDSLIGALNEIRKEGGMQAVREAAAQGEAAQTLAPHYFAAVWGLHPAALADTIALGLQAGWKVEPIVKYGKLTSTWIPHSDDPRRLLASALQRPTGRIVLLDPAVDTIAVGTVTSGHRNALGALMATYAHLNEQPQDVLVERVTKRLTAARKERGYGPPIPIKGVGQAALRAIELIEEEGRTPSRALQVYMQRSSQRLQRRVGGWYAEVLALEDFAPPEELLASPVVECGIAVAYYRAPGEPWGRYVVLILTVAAIPA